MATIDAATQARSVGGLSVESWGDGAPVVLLHGSLATGAEEWESQRTAGAPFPKLVVSGGHSAGFEAICDDLAGRIGAARKAVEGAGHEIQFTGPPSTRRCWTSGEPPGRRLGPRRYSGGS